MHPAATTTGALPASAIYARKWSVFPQARVRLDAHNAPEVVRASGGGQTARGAMFLRGCSIMSLAGEVERAN